MILYQKSRILTCIYYYNCDHEVNDSVSKSQYFNCWETGHRKQQCKNERVCGVCRKLRHAPRSTEYAAKNVRKAEKALDAKRIGHNIRDPQDWQSEKEAVMEEIVNAKVDQIPEINTKLETFNNDTMYSEVCITSLGHVVILSMDCTIILGYFSLTIVSSEWIVSIV
uniref:CCHC-type domain-containing protein n=1 Tax=Magallana gigas TaxID=29159 RepID=A0A8W8NPQ5_MAGGI